MTIADLEYVTDVDDFRRKGCGCVWCKKDKGNPNETHGSGAPIVKHPTTGKDTTYRRPSSAGKPLEDTYHLDLWAKRTVAYGVATTPSIAARIANLDPKEDKAKLNELAEEALVAAKGNQAADLGTELHRVVERLNKGEWTIDDVPELFKADAEAYLAELARHDLSVVPGMVELKVVNDHVRCAGTFDMILRSYLSDLKTGQSIDLAQVGIAVQLAIYRHASIYDIHTDERSDLPPMDSDVGLVVHLPYGTGTCRIVDVDIKAGWEAAQLAAKAKSWNYRKDLFTPREVKDPPKARGSQRIEPVNAPAPAESKTAPEGGPADADKVVALLERAKSNKAVAATVGRWVRDAARAHVDWRIGIEDKFSTERRYALSYVAVDLAEHLCAGADDFKVEDAVARAALAMVIGDDAHQPILAVGGLIGTLTIDQARRLVRIARSARLTFSDDGSPRLIVAA
jgi:hypothetical protein